MSTQVVIPSTGEMGEIGSMPFVVCGDCTEFTFPKDAVVVSDPPYNRRYKYDVFPDNLDHDSYIGQLVKTLRPPSVVIGYPELIFQLSMALKCVPQKTVAWVYNANTPRQWRIIAWFGFAPDFSKLKQPYKNTTDRRIKARIARGEAARMYDWWHVQQVKNVSKVGVTTHPCPMPLEIMQRIVTTIPPHKLIIDPYAGSGTTILAAAMAKRRAFGYELSPTYTAEANAALDTIEGRPAASNPMWPRTSMVTNTRGLPHEG